MNKLKFVVYFIVIISITSCTSYKKLQYLSNLDTAEVEQFHPLEHPQYRIQLQDILYIYISTLNVEMNLLLNPTAQQNAYSNFREESGFYIFGYTVSDSGIITLPMLGDIYVYGSTIEEISNVIKQKAELLLKDAVVYIRLLSFKYSVIGEVNRPGTFVNYNNQLTVLDAIGRAGDISDYGNREKVLVVRPTKNGTKTFRINLQDKNLLQSSGYFLLPNDVVIVGPIKSKPFQMNIPTMTLVLTTISTLILVLSFVNTK